MIGELYINEKDAWVTWGVFLEDGSEAKLLLPANTKEYASNNKRSSPGRQVFVTNTQPDERNVILIFCISAVSKEEYLKKYDLFVNELSSGWVKLRVPSLGKVFKLISPSFQDLSYSNRIGKLSVRFSEPNPLDRL